MTTPKFLRFSQVAAIGLMLGTGACGTSDSVQAEPTTTTHAGTEEATPAVVADSFGTMLEEAVLEAPGWTREETWPDDPVAGVWYRLNFLDYAFCGPESLYVPTDEPGTRHFNPDAVKTFRGGLFRRDDEAGLLLGFARLLADESIDYSQDGVANITNYPAVPAHEVSWFTCE